MFRVFLGALSQTTKSIIKQPLLNIIQSNNVIPQNIIKCNFSTILRVTAIPQQPLYKHNDLLLLNNNNSVRTVTKYSLGKGKRKSVKTVLDRFYRLNWGGWIRTKCGRGKKLWKKTSARKRRLRQHVFCNATQSTLLDKMVGSYWRKPKYYVDDPYEPYHTREEWMYGSRKPKPYYPNEN